MKRRTPLLSLSLSLPLSLMLFGATPVLAADAPKTFAEQTRSLAAQPGFIDLWRDADQGRVLLAISSFDTPFMMITELPYGLGSNDVGLDRGQAGDVKVVHFEKRGTRVFLVQENTRFIADSANRDERASATEAFAASVLWAGDILASDGTRQLVDMSSFLLADRHGVAKQLAATKQGAYSVDAKRSAVLPESAKSFPDNTELDAMLTFQGPGEGAFVRDVAPDAASLTMRQHVSFVRLPAAGFARRAYHPASGGIDTSYYDFAAPLASSIDVHWQLRFRLDKTVPGAAPSTVKKPIVYYVDRGAPEPVRSALIEGAGWWASAFEKAGFKDAYRVELLPEGVDPMDVRYNVIQWVHRSTRGWSYGNPMSDPRTGEIIKGTVTLGSQRVRQDILIAESLLAPFGKPGEQQHLAEQMALARLRQLAAHEVGHTLGFNHNFAASLNGSGSVMDYPHPVVKLDARGDVVLADAYGVGVGGWDDFLVAHAYAQFAPGEEGAALARLRAQVRARGYGYVSDADSRSAGAVHPGGLLWDFGGDPVKTWDQLMAVRQRALQGFSFGVLPDGRQSGEIEARLVPVYLLHRYQAEALARLLGGAEFEYSTSTDVRSGAARSGSRPVAAATQRAALTRLAASLGPETLALPANVLDQLTPAAQGYERSREYFGSRMNSVFDALTAAEAGAAQVCTFLFDAARLNRLAWQQARDAGQPGVQEVLDRVLQASWKRNAPAPGVVAGEAVQLAANWVVLDAMLGALNGPGLHPSVDAQLRQTSKELAAWLSAHPGVGVTAQSRAQAATLITRYLADPRGTPLRAMPAIPPGAPI